MDIIALDNCNGQVALEYNENENMVANGLESTWNWFASDYCGNNFLYARTDTCHIPALKLRTILNGAMFNNPSSSLMRDDLRLKNLIPSAEPYSDMAEYEHKGLGGGEAADPMLFNGNGDQAIIDWLFVEVRDTDSNGDSVISHSVRTALQKWRM